MRSNTKNYSMLRNMDVRLRPRSKFCCSKIRMRCAFYILYILCCHPTATIVNPQGSTNAQISGGQISTQFIPRSHCANTGSQSAATLNSHAIDGSRTHIRYPYTDATSGVHDINQTSANQAGAMAFNVAATMPNNPNNYVCSTNSNRPQGQPLHMQSLHNPMYAATVVTPKKLIDLPTFSGHAEDWPIFYASYMQSTAAYNYSNLDNNQRLQKCLQGDARETVNSLLIHPDNVGAVLEQLSFRFGRPDQLIRSQIKKVREIMPIAENMIAQIIPFATKTRNLAVFLQSVNGQQHLANPTLLEELVNKLPMTKRIEWAKFAAQIQPYPTVVNFSDWLSDLANIICLVQDTEVKKRTILHTSGNESVEKLQCPICKTEHSVVKCKTFVNAPIAERWQRVKRHNLCFSCLKPGHVTRYCRNRKMCSVEACKRKHHELLHETVRRNSPLGNNKSSETKKSGRENAVLSCSANSAEVVNLLYRILPVTLYGQNKRLNTYALLDEGSSVTMIDSDLINGLGLKGQEHRLNMQWVGGRTAQENTTLVNLYIGAPNKQKKHFLKDVYGVRNLNLPMQTLRKEEWASRYPKLPVQPYEKVVPKMLIGLDNCHLGLPSKVQNLCDKGPYAANTKLGWVVFGPTKSNVKATHFNLHTDAISCKCLHDLVTEHFTTESFGVRPSPPVESKADRRAKDILKRTTLKINGRFQTGLLWESDEIELPDSYPMAFKRLIGIEQKMKRDAKFAAAYSALIDSYVNKKYAKKLLTAEAKVCGSRTWYLPHFGVTNPNKPEKLRLVFDAAAEVKGVALNSFLLKGPQNPKPLPAILFHFREGEVAVCGDIKEMFHQVLIQPEDRSAQRFLWRNGDSTKSPDTYEMVAMTFGAACSPCSAEYVKTENALSHIKHSRRAIKSIIDFHYVDDFVDSFSSVREAIEISCQVKEIHLSAGFELRNFASNSPKVLKALQGKVDRVAIRSKESQYIEKVLGMYWQPETDTFKFKLKFNYVADGIITGSKYPTKRELLSIVMSIYDPQGFLCHFTIAAKILLKEVWRGSICWDEPLPDKITASWHKWRNLLSEVVKFDISRFYFINGRPIDLQLHVFVDASEDAFAAVAYWRYLTNKKYYTSFISAKTRTSPLKPLTIPRLELQAAVLGARLAKTILKEHSFSVSRLVLWSDSRTVIKWIASEHRRYKPFVAHRIAEILSHTSIENWSWLPTHENVADEATRSNTKIDFCSNSRWCKGPAFLQQKDCNWPATLHIDSAEIEAKDEEELAMKYTMIISNFRLIEVTRFSSFSRLLRTIGWVIRFANICKKENNVAWGIGLTVHELDAAETCLCRQAQHEVFSDEINTIQNKRPIKKDNVLYQLAPYIDDKGLLRVNGRIDAASCIPFETKRPIILPNGHPFTALVTHHYHVKMKHQNIEASICETRRRYWIPRLRQLMRKTVTKCQVCKIMRARPVEPMMGPLPEDRVTPYVRPFAYTGMDYFGPINVTIGRRCEKRWVALFTCLAVRAVHLEIAHDLSTDACIMAIRNFINRRGVPVRIRSDNGTNFVGANNEAQRFSEVFECGRIQDELSAKRVEWIFSSPANPSEGGVWERMVQCVKRVLRQTLKEVAPREYTLQCLVIEAENVVNSRPLTHLPVTLDQQEPLTPNHFLLGCPNTAQTPSVQDPSTKLCAVRKQWRIARQLRDCFWKRWVIEYLPTLTRRSKWCQKTKAIGEGDLVFICDPNLPRHQWTRARVEGVHPGADGVVRKVDVRTAAGLARRPVSKLAILDVEL